MVKTKKSGKPYVYTVKFTPKKVFDVDETFTGDELVKLLPAADLAGFASGAGILKFGEDRALVQVRLKKGRYTLTGDEIFKGLSRGMVNTAKAREHLKKKGYTAIRYNGGVNMNMARKHDVYVAWDPKDIRIDKIQQVVSRQERRDKANGR